MFLGRLGQPMAVKINFKATLSSRECLLHKCSNSTFPLEVRLTTQVKTYAKIRKEVKSSLMGHEIGDLSYNGCAQLQLALCANSAHLMRVTSSCTPSAARDYLLGYLFSYLCVN